MTPTNIETIFNELPENLRQVVTILSVPPILTQTIAEKLLQETHYANGNASQIVNELKSFPVWIKRNRINWAIDRELREFALNKLNGSGLRIRRTAFAILNRFYPELEEKSFTEAKDFKLQISRLALSIPEERDNAIESLRSLFESAELFNNFDSARVISSYIDENLLIESGKGRINETILSAYYMRGLYAYRTRDYKSALRYLNWVWKQRGNSYSSIKDAAIAAHIVGLIYSKDRNQFNQAENAYLQSEEIGKQISHTQHLAQVYHSLGNLYSKDRNRFKEAEKFYLQSLELRTPVNDLYGLAQVYHSLGNLYSKDRNRFKEAEDAYLQSIVLDKLNKNQYGLAQVYHSLGNLYSKDRNRFNQAEKFYLQSLELRIPVNDLYGLAQTYHSLGNLYSKDRKRFKEAEDAYLQSLEIEKLNNNRYGLAQVYANFGKLKRNQGDYVGAREMFEESLKYQREHRFIALVQQMIDELPK